MLNADLVYMAGDNLDEAAANTVAALRQHVGALESAGRAVPAPRSMDDVLRDKDVRSAMKGGAVLIAVPLLSDAGRTLTRSAFLAQAAREKIVG